MFTDFLLAAPPWEPKHLLADTATVTCNAAPGPFDDDLHQCAFQVLNAGTAGWFGNYGEHSTTLLGSTDVSSFVVSLVPLEFRIADVGHYVILKSDRAPSLVFAPICDWINAR